LAAGVSNPTMRVERQLTLINPKGFHVRPAGLVAELALRFSADIHLVFDGKQVNAKSTMKLLTIASPQGTDVVLTAEGDDAEPAVDAIEELFKAGFHEMEKEAPDTGLLPKPRNE